MGKYCVMMCAVIISALSAGCGDVGPAGAPGRDGVDGADGLDGLNGDDGVNGVDGATGPAGADGAASSIEVIDEPAGDNCAYGGKAIRTGVDVDGDGVLSAPEIRSLDYVCDGAPGADGSDGLSAVLRTSYLFAGERCPYGGRRIEVGLDADRSGALDDGEVQPEASQIICNDAVAYRELTPLPTVEKAHGFALTASEDDGSPRLGFMFTDAAYQELLVDEIADIGGVYSGPSTYVTYALGAGGWDPYEGRKTPQTYSYSELVVSGGASYYTTSYPAFGGLIAVIRDGGKGSYALTPAFSDRKAHSIALLPGGTEVYALAAQQSGLTLSSYPTTEFGTVWPNLWTNYATLETEASAVHDPRLLAAGEVLVGGYLLGGRYAIHATAAPGDVASAADFPEIAACEDAVLGDLAWDGADLYVGCVDTSGELSVQRLSLADLTHPAVEVVPTGVVGTVDALDLEAAATGVSVALRQGAAVRVYAAVGDATPAFDAILAGQLDLARTSSGLVLAVCDLEGSRTLRTFVD